jgi:hypothetical protein
MELKKLAIFVLLVVAALAFSLPAAAQCCGWGWGGLGWGGLGWGGLGWGGLGWGGLGWGGWGGWW